MHGLTRLTKLRCWSKLAHTNKSDCHEIVMSISTYIKAIAGVCEDKTDAQFSPAFLDNIAQLKQ